jgi:dTDP-4-dehydrorhamnose reductase
VKILLLGAAGQVGRAVASALPPGHECAALDRSALDIRDAKAVADRCRELGAAWLVNAAAYTAVDAAEDDPATALAVNADAVLGLVGAARSAGARLLHLSTDFVFDGRGGRAYTPASPVNPLSVYGRTKLAGERHVLGDPEGIVLRTSWVYAAAGRNFVLTLLKLMRERDEVRVVCDQIGSPTWATGLARTIWALLEAAPPGGIYHWCDAGVASWYDFAVAIQEEALQRGLLDRAVPVVPISTAEFPTRAVRPSFSVLDTRSTCAAAHCQPVHWRRQLGKMLDELRTA